MADESDDRTEDATGDGTEETAVQAIARHVEPDHLLQLLQASVNVFGGQQSVTLLIGGRQISGHLTSAREWLTTVADEDLGPAVSAMLRAEAETYPEPGADDAQDDDNAEPVYLHLLDALQVGPPWLEIGAWRGRLVSVDGWTFGRFKAVDRD